MDAKRTYKDSVFRDIFNNKRRLRRLYKALSGRDVPLSGITITTLRGTFMNDLKNDISFSAGGRLVILLEHQSTWNPNMPYRFLQYVAKLYARMVSQDIVYTSEIRMLAAPEFYVLYNGEREEPYHQELRLSDAFSVKTGALELTAQCYNINYAENNELIASCYELKAYSIFVQKVREGKQQGLSRYHAIKQAIDYCESHDLMADYFRKHESEVFDMVSFKWDDQKAKEVAVKEAETATEKRLTTRFVISLLKDRVPLKAIIHSTNLSADEIRKIAEDHGLAF